MKAENWRSVVGWGVKEDRWYFRLWDRRLGEIVIWLQKIKENPNILQYDFKIVDM